MQHARPGLRSLLPSARLLILAGLVAACSFSKKSPPDEDEASRDGGAEEIDGLAVHEAEREEFRHDKAAPEDAGAGIRDGQAAGDGIDPYGVSRAVPRKEKAAGGLLRSEEAAPKASAPTRLSGRRQRDCRYEFCPPPPQPYPMPPPYPRPPALPPGGEEYASLPENSFLDARTHPLSTFSIDVDGASYANVRRFLLDNRLPPPEAVRVEELINSFAFDYPQPFGGDPFSITTESAATPWNPDTRLVLIGLQGRRVPERRLPPRNLVFLIDVSGSMASADKLPLLKDGFDMLVDRLRPQDRISIVVYAGAAGMVLPATRGDDRQAIREALSRLDAGGSTAGGAGLKLAYQAARESFIRGGDNRVILATDGDFNVGLSGDEELSRFIEEKRKGGVYLSVLGFGTGNIKDAKMELLADKGNGNYYYIDGIREARKVLVERMAGTLHVIAKDVKLQVEFNPAAVKSYRLVGYENRALAAEDFNDDAKDAGELGAGHSVTALYEIVPAGPARPRVDPLKYQDGREQEGGRESWRGRSGEGRASGPGGGGSASELLTVKLRYKRPEASESRRLSRVLRNQDRDWRDASENFRFAAAVAGFGLLLGGSRHAGGDLGYDLVQSLARGARGGDASGDRSEFIHLAGVARLLGETEAYGYPDR